MKRILDRVKLLRPSHSQKMAKHIAISNVIHCPHGVADIGEPLRAVGPAGRAVEDSRKLIKVVAADGVGGGDVVKGDGGDAGEGGLREKRGETRALLSIERERERERERNNAKTMRLPLSSLLLSIERSREREKQCKDDAPIPLLPPSPPPTSTSADDVADMTTAAPLNACSSDSSFAVRTTTPSSGGSLQFSSLSSLG